MIRLGRHRVHPVAPAAVLLALVTLAAIAGGPAASGSDHPAVGPAGLSQSGRALAVGIETDHRLALRSFGRRPDFNSRNARFLCLELGHAGKRGKARICLGGPRGTYRQAGVTRLGPGGKVVSRITVRVRLRRIAGRRLSLSLDPRRAGFAPGRYRWRMLLSDRKCGEHPCRSAYPAGRLGTFRLRPVRAVGCTGGNGELVLHGPRHGKRVALTFDDGPGPDTPAVLRTLRHFRVKATFFMLGMQVNLYPSLARKVLRAGHEVATHSSVHALLPGYSDIAASVRTIRHRTGFRPCLFRPPYGATSSSLIASARRARLKAVNWDVDTNDWRLPGPGAIQAAITGGVRPGSIVLMHDAGGPRGQTVAALPGAIRSLRRHGYRFVTVSGLLGNRVIYRPVR